MPFVETSNGQISLSWDSKTDEHWDSSTQSCSSNNDPDQIKKHGCHLLWTKIEFEEFEVFLHEKSNIK